MKSKNGILAGLKSLPKYLNSTTISSGIIAGIFGWAMALILYANGTSCGWSTEETISWIFACWVFGPVIGLFLSLKYHLPFPARVVYFRCSYRGFRRRGRVIRCRRCAWAFCSAVSWFCF